MYNLLTLNKIAKIGLDTIPADEFTISDSCENPDGILLRSFQLKNQALPESLLAVARAGAGVNNIQIADCTDKGIPVFNTPGANANAVKELVLAALFMSSRNVKSAFEWVETIKDKGDEIEDLVEKGKSQFVGPEVFGKKLGVIGLGAIGVLVANAATHLGLTVYGYDPYISVENAWNLSRSVQHVTDINELYANCDYITVHIPLNDATKGTINEAALAEMKDGVRIINIARGGIVDDDAMIAALESGKVACYFTDFPNGKILGKKNVVALPHLGASTPESEDNCAVMASRELVSYLKFGSVNNAVNFPNVDLPRLHTGRIALFNSNVPNMLSSITSTVGEFGYNIENLINKSKKGGTVAYTVIDLDKVPSDELVNKLTAMDGIIRVRVIG